jgi:Ca-activated chloride channel family protein
MSFEWPLGLALLVFLPLLAYAYVLAQRRRPRYAARFTNVDLLANVVKETPSWRRHVPALLAFLSLTALTLAVARPHAEVAVAKEQAAVVLVTDISGSMMATDVDPDRLSAARDAAKQFASELPDDFRLGLVTFSSQAQLAVPPTTDRATVEGALDAMRAQGGTAMGDGLSEGLDALREFTAQAVEEDAGPGSGDDDGAGGDAADSPPAVVVLLSDGESTSGRLDPLTAAGFAADQGVPVHTVALGTDEGTITLTDPQTLIERTLPVPPDRDTLRRVAEDTGGRYFDAPSADELSQIYEDLGSQVGTEQELTEVTAAFAGGGALLLLGAGALSLLWFGRIP